MVSVESRSPLSIMINASIPLNQAHILSHAKSLWVNPTSLYGALDESKQSCYSIRGMLRDLLTGYLTFTSCMYLCMYWLLSKKLMLHSCYTGRFICNFVWLQACISCSVMQPYWHFWSDMVGSWGGRVYPEWLEEWTRTTSICWTREYEPGRCGPSADWSSGSCQRFDIADKNNGSSQEGWCEASGKQLRLV